MCADFGRLDGQLRDLRDADIRLLHLDFADGAFVPSLILGPEVFGLLRGHDEFILESHLMLNDPRRFIELFAPACASVIVHVEAAPDIGACIDAIHLHGARAGLALNPETPVAAVMPWLGLIDQVLVMTVHPGFASAAFVPASVEHVREIRQAADAAGLALPIEVDGSVNPTTIPALVEAGADLLVGGSSGLFVPEGLPRAAALMRAATVRTPFAMDS
jgi:ribulose-phosphate 3-epimerase